MLVEAFAPSSALRQNTEENKRRRYLSLDEEEEHVGDSTTASSVTYLSHFSGYHPHIFDDCEKTPT